MKKFTNFYEAWWFLAEHPSFNHLKDGKPDVLPGFMSNMEVFAAKVNPDTLEVDGDRSKNTKTQIWLEAGPYARISDPMGYPGDTYDEMGTHDIRLDCGGDTYEEAIINMANLVLEHYGD